MSHWTTRPGKPPLGSVRSASPGLLYQKWQAWDLRRQRNDDVDPESFTSPKRKDARLDHLGRIASSIHAVYGHEQHYRGWHRRYTSSLDELPGGPVERVEIQTLWRLVVGMATNPALETGLTLHPLLGVPVIPGSAVKGLAHHVAEAELAETLGAAGEEAEADDPACPPCPEDPERLLALLSEAARVRAIFGSLAVERARKPNRDGSPGDPWRRWTPQSILAAWRSSETIEGLDDEDLDLRHRIDALLQPTGGAVRFYDAVPAPAAGAVNDLVQVDVMTPHYPKYYDSGGRKHPPSDDQDPVPVTFLAVAPGAPFQFFFRLRPTPLPEEVASPAAARKLVHGWLTTGLTEWGAGAKTAAGYGYFFDPRSPRQAETPDQSGDSAQRDTRTEPEERRLLPPGLGAGELSTRLDQAIDSASEEEQAQIAQEALRHYGKVIRGWEKKKRKGNIRPAGAKRLQWLAKYSGEAGSQQRG